MEEGNGSNIENEFHLDFLFPSGNLTFYCLVPGFCASGTKSKIAIRSYAGWTTGDTRRG